MFPPSEIIYTRFYNTVNHICLDQIAIPNLANFGAMENWGIVTFREDSLLWNRNDSSTANRQRVASVIAHEMTHQVGMEIIMLRIPIITLHAQFV